jgi:protein-S-isoprenylcysteine O-methyltransferase Ste14
LKYWLGREANSAPLSWIVFKTLFQTAIFWALFLFLFPALILWGEERLGLNAWRFEGAVYRWLGAALFIVAGTVGLTSGMTMAIYGRGTPLPTDCARELVIRGVYRYIRNPMAVAGLMQGVAVGFYHGSLSIILYALIGAPVWNTFVRPWEEADLERRFGESYLQYCASVKCWIPHLTGYTPPQG